MKQILKDHKLWLETGGNEGTRANLRNVDLRNVNLGGAKLADADLQGADLRYADLRNVDLRYADLRNVNLQGADLRNVNLRYADLRNAKLVGADLRYADLRNVNLRYADLRNADLQGAYLGYANLQNTRLPSPIMMLMAAWGELSDELTAVLMRLDASGHPEGETAFDAWAEGGPCPYDGCQVQRVADFKERKECWWGLEVPKMGLYEIMVRVLREKCSV